MQFVYKISKSVLIFFFIIVLFDGVVLVNNNTFADKFLAALVFAVFMYIVENVLKFFKLPINTGSIFLMSLILSFIYFFFAIYLFQLISVGISSLNLGITFIPEIKIMDKTVGLVFLSLASSILAVFVESVERG